MNRILFVALFFTGIFSGLLEGEEPENTPAPRSIAAARSPDVPIYVGSLADNYIWGILYKKPKPEWIQFGVEHRNRLQMRDQNYRSSDDESQLLLLGRTLIYGAVRDVLDPFQFDLELINSREFGGDSPDSSKNLNFLDLHQAYAGFYFKGSDGPFDNLSFKAGRMSFDFVDRRLVARNRFRNTINNFDGFRIQGTTDDLPITQFDIFATRPVDLHKTGFDKTSTDQYFFGASAVIDHGEDSRFPVMEPYWLYLRDARNPFVDNRYTLGIHLYDDFLHHHSGFLDWDASIAYQFGSDSNQLDVQAWASHLELAYNLNADWKPRFAAWINISSGDSDPSDMTNGNFDSLFGATYGFHGFTSFFEWQNVINPTAHIAFQPSSRFKVETIYRFYWLHQASAGWTRTNRFNPPGASRQFVGSELDFRIRYRMTRLANLESGAGLFFPGDFAEISGPSPFATFVYTAITLSL